MKFTLLLGTFFFSLGVLMSLNNKVSEEVNDEIIEIESGIAHHSDQTPEDKNPRKVYEVGVNFEQK